MSEELDKVTKENVAKEVGALFRRGIWNSALLAFWFATAIQQSYENGSYVMVGLCTLCIYFAVNDALTFYSYYKMNKSLLTETKNG